jgi:hypothetical protein
VYLRRTGVPISDANYRLAVGAGGAALVVLLGYIQFCGSVSVPPKPPPPAGPSGTARELVARATGQLPLYEQGLREDAHNADVALPSVHDMSRKLAYRGDDVTHVLVVGQPLEVAGLKLTLQAAADSLQLVIASQVQVPVAYRVDTETSMGSICNSAQTVPFDAMVLQPGRSETRTECIYRPDVTTKVTHVETVELSPLSAYYIEQLPPRLVGIDERIARGHHPLNPTCSSALPEQVRSGIESNQIKWRDLIDFYARHSCERYLFPAQYRAFTKDDEIPLPAVDSRM